MFPPTVRESSCRLKTPTTSFNVSDLQHLHQTAFLLSFMVFYSFSASVLQGLRFAESRLHCHHRERSLTDELSLWWEQRLRTAALIRILTLTMDQWPRACTEWVKTDPHIIIIQLCILKFMQTENLFAHINKSLWWIKPNENRIPSDIMSAEILQHVET